MSERERLIALLFEANDVVKRNGFQFNALVMADYLLKHGVIVPPVKVGATLYQIVDTPSQSFVSTFPRTVEPYQIIYRNIMGHHSCIPFEDFGKTVFLTHEEAEAALAEREKK